MQKTLTKIILSRSAAFEKGYKEGRSGNVPPWMNLSNPIDEYDIVIPLRNLCEIAVEGWLTDAMLSRTAGILLGWWERVQLEREVLKAAN
jgi:hypothetical protein